VAQPGRALRSGRRGRRFESYHSDHSSKRLAPQSGDTMGLVALPIIGIIISFIAHWYLKKFPLAVIVSTLASIFFLMIVDLIKQGYLDKFWIVAFIVLSGFYSTLSIFVGLGLEYWRESQNKNFLGMAEEDDD
jgi:hypothetical protein